MYIYIYKYIYIYIQTEEDRQIHAQSGRQAGRQGILQLTRYSQKKKKMPRKRRGRQSDGRAGISLLVTDGQRNERIQGQWNGSGNVGKPK